MLDSFFWESLLSDIVKKNYTFGILVIFFFNVSYTLVHRKFACLKQICEVVVSLEYKCSLRVMRIQAKRAHSLELLSIVIWDFKAPWNLGNYWVFWYGLLSNFYFYFWSRKRYPWWTGQARPGPANPAKLWCSMMDYFCQFKRYKLEILT